MKVVVKIEERLLRTVVVEAPDDYESYDIEEIVQDACGEGIIDLDFEDFDNRFVSVVDKTVPEQYYEHYKIVNDELIKDKEA